jgi:4-hydroxy-2-oxoheptanedioate aldolase
VPHVSTPEDAHAAVQAAHYPPLGTRGLAVSTRAGHHGTVPLHQHLADAAASTVVIGQVEDKDSIIHSPQIAATRRLNAVWIGPSDLSLSMGLPGQMDHPDVVAAIDQIANDVFASTDCALCILVDSPQQAEAWRNRGARILLFNSTSILANGLQGISRQLREVPKATNTLRAVDAMASPTA